MIRQLPLSPTIILLDPSPIQQIRLAPKSLFLEAPFPSTLLEAVLYHITYLIFIPIATNGRKLQSQARRLRCPLRLQALQRR
jgi:hypothetical protein